MAKTESTAVNELIDRMQNPKLPALDPAADLFAAPPSTSSPRIPLPPGGRASSLPAPHGRASSPSVASSHPARMTSTIPAMRGAGEIAPLPRARAPHSTAEQAMPDARLRMTTAPAARGTTIPPLPPRSAMGTLPPPTAPIAAPFERAAKLSSPDLVIPRRDLVVNADETWVGELPAGRTRADNIALAKKLVMPAIACIAAGIALGFYVSATKTRPGARTATPTVTTTTPTTAAPAPSAPPTETVLHPTPRSAESQNAGTSTAGGDEPQPPTKAEQAAQVAAAAGDGSLTHDAPAEAVAKVQPAKGVVSLTDVRIDTDPQGASITLVDRGAQFPLGSTPLSTSLDPSRQYDVIVEMTGRPAQMVHLDPATTTRLDLSLGRKQRAAAPAAVKVDAEPAKATQAESPASAIDAIDAPKAKATKAVKAEAAVTTEAPKAAAATGNGTLMVSSKPPCDILIDGAATGLTTPQRALDLAAGRHTITFVNQDAKIKKTVTVTIKSGEPTKLIQDLMAK